MSAISAGLALAWRAAAFEAANAGFERVELAHIFLGLCKVTDLTQEDLEALGLSADDAALIASETATLRERFSALSLDPTRARRRLRAILGQGEFDSGGKRVMHRSPDCRRLFQRAMEIATGRADAETLLELVLKSPGGGRAAV